MAIADCMKEVSVITVDINSARLTLYHREKETMCSNRDSTAQDSQIP